MDSTHVFRFGGGGGGLEEKASYVDCLFTLADT